MFGDPKRGRCVNGRALNVLIVIIGLLNVAAVMTALSTSGRCEGALAYSQNYNGGWGVGYSENLQTKDEARGTAMQECLKRGIACRVLTQFHNSCAALAVANVGNAFAYATRDDIVEARQEALRRCAIMGTPCSIRAAFCDAVSEDAIRAQRQAEQERVAGEIEELGRRQRAAAQAAEKEEEKQATTSRQRAATNIADDNRTAARRALNALLEGCSIYVVTSCELALRSQVITEDERQSALAQREIGQTFERDQKRCEAGAIDACDTAIASPAADSQDREKLTKLRAALSPTEEGATSEPNDALGSTDAAFYDVVSDGTVLTPGDVFGLREHLSEVSKKHNISIIVSAIKCNGNKGELSFELDRISKVIFMKYEKLNSPLAISIVACSNFSFLGARFSQQGIPHAVSSGLIFSKEVRSLQLSAQRNLRGALNDYVELVATRYRPSQKAVEGWQQWFFNVEGVTEPIMLGIISMTADELAVSREKYLLSKGVTNIVHRMTWVSSLFASSIVAMFVVVVLGVIVKFVIVDLPSIVLMGRGFKYSAIFYNFISFILVEILWSLPLIGVLAAMGGGLLEHQWLMSDIIGKDIGNVYNAIFDASAKIGEFPVFIKLILAAMISIRIYLFAFGVVFFIPIMTGLISSETVGAINYSSSWMIGGGIFVAWYVLIPILPPVVVLYFSARAIVGWMLFAWRMAATRWDE